MNIRFESPFLEPKGSTRKGYGTALTSREREIIERKIAGETNKGVAFTLGIKEQTVKNHISTILIKTGAPNMVALVAEYMRQTISPPPEPIPTPLDLRFQSIEERLTSLAERVAALETAVMSLIRKSLGNLGT